MTQSTDYRYDRQFHHDQGYPPSSPRQTQPTIHSTSPIGQRQERHSGGGRMGGPPGGIIPFTSSPSLANVSQHCNDTSHPSTHGQTTSSNPVASFTSAGLITLTPPSLANRQSTIFATELKTSLFVSPSWFKQRQYLALDPTIEWL